MKKLYLLFAFLFILFFQNSLMAQPCGSLTATCVGYESRCASTGSIKIFPQGGSGSFKYKVNGPVNTNYTSTDSITGLSAGTYSVTISDITNNCTYTVNNVVVDGTYQDPRFVLNKVDVSCDNAFNGSISVGNQQFGLGPFSYSIVAPSSYGVGTISPTGSFENLPAGQYAIQLTDSCGGIQTRQITINNYTWQLVEYPFTKTSCNDVNGYIKVVDSRGNISTVSGIPGFMYGIVRTPGDTLWSPDPNIAFTLFGTNSFQVVAKDSCGIIKLAPLTVSLTPNIGNIVGISKRTCSTFNATITQITNFFDGLYCIYDSMDVQLACNTTGVFSDLPYGSYCITAYDACTDTTIRRCFTALPPALSIANNVLIRDKTCSDFTAAVTGQTGLTNPTYCLFDTLGNLITCNNTGIFTNLRYGNYCIQTRDGCRDTSITRCFAAYQPTPVVPVIVPAYVNCVNFGIIVGGDTLFEPQYCLYDTAGVLIACNSTGIFDNIPLGSYCVNIYDSCYDTTIIRCFTVGLPIAQNDINIRINDRTCTTFTAIAATASLSVIRFCLYNAADSLLACSNTGEFPNLPYGNYCIKARLGCPDTLMVSCFTVAAPIPSVRANVGISNETCTRFTASITGQANLNNPQYCIYDSANVLLVCNTTGIFNNLSFGSYCIRIINTCYDTTIVRCFTRLKAPIDINVTPNRSCSFGYARFTVSASSAILPILVTIYNPDSTVFLSRSFTSTPINIDSIPGLPGGLQYKIVATDVCGSTDSAFSNAVASFFNHNTVIIPKCPGSTWANGSGNIAMTINTNMGSITVRIIKKDGVTYGSPLVPNTASAGVYTFTDMGPGTYILRSSESTCNRFVYDTVSVRPYIFPNLNRSSAYQCDENGFSVSAVATNGVPPYTYQIIGSVPSTPQIFSTPQASTIFNINNGSTYSLIRLRALDACGNATLGDASILPLASNGISATYNCLFYPTTMSVDTIINATYEWWKKDSLDGTDSIFVGAQPSVTIPMVLPSDTAYYVCYLNVNLGCIKRTFYYHLTGGCFTILPVNLIEFKGKQEQTKNILQWKTTQEQQLARYEIERQTNTGAFVKIGHIQSRGSTLLSQYQFIDEQPGRGKHFYRLKMIDTDGSFTYSNIVLLSNKQGGLNYSIFPNPVTEQLFIRFDEGEGVAQRYQVQLLSTTYQMVWQKTHGSIGSNQLQLTRPPGLPKGMYLLRILNTATKEQVTEKLIFL